MADSSLYEELTSGWVHCPLCERGIEERFYPTFTERDRYYAHLIEECPQFPWVDRETYKHIDGDTSVRCPCRWVLHREGRGLEADQKSIDELREHLADGHLTTALVLKAMKG